MTPIEGDDELEGTKKALSAMAETNEKLGSTITEQARINLELQKQLEMAIDANKSLSGAFHAAHERELCLEHELRETKEKLSRLSENDTISLDEHEKVLRIEKALSKWRMPNPSLFEETLDESRAWQARTETAEAQLAAVLDASHKLLNLWGELSSQEMYGELMQEGMEEQDYSSLINALDDIRVLLSPGGETGKVHGSVNSSETEVRLFHVCRLAASLLLQRKAEAKRILNLNLTPAMLVSDRDDPDVKYLVETYYDRRLGPCDRCGRIAPIVEDEASDLCAWGCEP